MNMKQGLYLLAVSHFRRLFPGYFYMVLVFSTVFGSRVLTDKTAGGKMESVVPNTFSSIIATILSHKLEVKCTNLNAKR